MPNILVSNHVGNTILLNTDHVAMIEPDLDRMGHAVVQLSNGRYISVRKTILSFIDELPTVEDFR